MTRKILLALFIWPTLLFAQLSDDFEDGDISNWKESTVGHWAASGDSPLNGSFSLHHIFDNTEAGKDQVSVQTPVLDLSADITSWKFKIKYKYNPSDGNNWSAFIVSDADAMQMIPGGEINGYALGVNFTGSDDLLKFYKVTSGNSSTVITTSLDWDADLETDDTIAIEVIRSETGNWEIFYNAKGDFNNLLSIGAGFDDTYVYANYFGFYYDYTSSADQLLWIDDIEITGQVYSDIIPPVIDSLSIISSDTIYLEFNEVVDSLSAVNILNYSIDQSIGNPDSVLLNDTKKSLKLLLSDHLSNKEYYNLSITNIEDIEGNIIKDTSISFLYFIPESFDVVVNEIMADPTPEVNLPGYEYIEIKNTTSFNIDLTGWKLKVGTSVKDFPEETIDSASYVILCSETAAEYMDDYGSIISFSSISITNSGSSLLILDDKDTVIDSVNFTTEWYHHSDKEDGGWSIEKIDPINNCSGITNWKASENSNGGTPGVENSVFAPNIDTNSPQILNIEMVSDHQLRIYFDEPVTELSINENQNYSVNNGIGNPNVVEVSENFMQADLSFSNVFPTETELTLSIEDLSDACGNTMVLKEINFLYYLVKANDIVFNEMMADPEPALALPEYEYLEIYNTSEFDIDLKNWTLTVGSTVRSIPSGSINSGDYLVLCHEDAQTGLQAYGEVLVVSGFPSLANSGQTLVLRNDKGEIITQLSYSDSWYQDDYKAEGGWALEQIDPMNPCGEENNWIASVSETGGTPGQQNSVYGNNPDLQSPELLRIVVIDDRTIQLFFNETIDSISAMQTSIYAVDHGVGNPVSIDLIGYDYQSVKLGFENEFQLNTIYNLEITEGIFDCVGNEIYDKNTAQFAIPALPEENDLVINEILFNSYPDGYDFVEIYNRSDNTIDLKDVLIASYDNESLEYHSVETLTSQGYLIFPGSYLVLTENPGTVQDQYYSSNPNGFLEVENLPAYNDDEGEVILLDKYENIIDRVYYSEDMQFDLLATKEGVSLERINYNRASNDKTNWHSASELVGFATPAYENSQFMELTDMEDEVKIEPETFSPDNDGFEDITNINFTFSEPGYVAHIKIFDSKGRLVRYLANNQLLGINGLISWDGIDDHNQKAPVGIYVVYIELFDLDGNVKKFKKKVVIATKW